MPISINTKLVELANNYYISHGTSEQVKIDSSVVTLKSRLINYFGNNVLKIIEFGSYKRDTILPRQIDENSDVDLMVVFNHSSLGVSPGTYRNYLINFADNKYSRSNVKKSSPTVVLELDHIKYDLVPSYEQKIAWSLNSNIYIPQNDTSWMITDPNGFNAELTRINTMNGYNIKRVIRLLKAWNAKVGYPVKSFMLEQEIARGSFFQMDKSLEGYFFSAINNLSQYQNGQYFSPNQKIVSLKENAARVKSYLQGDNSISAMVWLSHILPI